MQTKREIAKQHREVYSRMLDASTDAGKLPGNTKFYNLFFSPAVDTGLYDIRELLRKAIAECDKDLRTMPDTLPWEYTRKTEPCVMHMHGIGWWNIVKGDGGYVAFHENTRLGMFATLHEAMAKCEQVYREVRDELD